jgi:acetyl-CoA carboxylase biotin carboxylase subunit
MQKVLIANRGEIAIRIIRACRDLGLRSVAVFSVPDANALHVQMADETICIGEGPAHKSYLNIPQILAAAEICGADAIHPGYGFLSERAEFAEAVERSGLIWIGPPSQAIARLGNKLQAKALARAGGVPVIPGSPSALEGVEEACELAEQFGFPVLLKTASGGGGKGIRRVEGRAEMAHQWAAAEAESKAAVGRAEIYLEKELLHPRHVEIQVLADQYGHCVALGERDCTVQRRRQKLLEEAPCAHLNADLRRALGEAACYLAKAAGYASAGTAEFLLTEDGSFYFMEFNSRIQVEHTVTEMVTGLDLVAWQLRIARAEALPFQQNEIQLRGHAVQARIVAEDASHHFAPSPGKLLAAWWPQGPGIRVDSGVMAGCSVLPFYDSMLGKVIAYGDSREEALKRLERALFELRLDGVTHLGGFLARVIRHPDFQAQRHVLGWLEEQIEGGQMTQLSGEMADVPSV